MLKNGEVGNGRKVGPSNEGATSVGGAASLLNVGSSSIERAKQVIDSKSKPLIAAVESGDVSVSLAAKLINECDDELIETQGDPWAYVWSSMMRKNHSESQLSFYAAEWQEITGPKKRGPKKKGKANSGNVSLNSNGQQRDAAGDKFGITGRTVSKAANVLEKGCKQLQQAKPQKSKPPAAR